MKDASRKAKRQHQPSPVPPENHNGAGPSSAVSQGRGGMGRGCARPGGGADDEEDVPFSKVGSVGLGARLPRQPQPWAASRLAAALPG
jgi:hypothetical protein